MSISFEALSQSTNRGMGIAGVFSKIFLSGALIYLAIRYVLAKSTVAVRSPIDLLLSTSSLMV